jgi:hypothetical protein
MAKIDTYFKKLPNDVVQIGVGAAAGAAAMTIAEQVVAKRIRAGVTAWRAKVQQLKASGNIAEADKLAATPPMGAGKLSATTIKDLVVLGTGIAIKAAAPKNTYTEYATDGIIFFAVADLITRKIATVSYSSEF